MSAPSCASDSMVATSSFSDPWKCSPDTARCRGSIDLARSLQKSALRSSPLDRTTARMPCTSPSKMAAISWSVGLERRGGTAQGMVCWPPKRERCTSSPTSTPSSVRTSREALSRICRGVRGAECSCPVCSSRTAGFSPPFEQDSRSCCRRERKRSCKSTECVCGGMCLTTCTSASISSPSTRWDSACSAAVAATVAASCSAVLSCSAERNAASAISTAPSCVRSCSCACCALPCSSLFSSLFSARPRRSSSKAAL
mmetsp:Transcript_18071/g.39346  ORF Transcript_18071/g.39346 Transcript_18071/m.39346 type:complete len:256 (-) Transcript_18071:3530-4297(-)